MPRGKQRAGMSKMEAVRRTLNELGKDAMPVAIQQHLKSKYQLAMATSVISNYKGMILKKGKRKGRRGRPAAKVGAAHGSNGAVRLEDLQAVKLLVARLGAAHVQTLAAIFE